MDAARTSLPNSDGGSGVRHDGMANAIRALSMDAVQRANSGHPGMPMGMADVATVLFQRFLSFDPERPDWPDRDRLILSAGHGSMLIYALLYLTGYRDITLDEIKNFRQLGSRTAGHPEFGHCAGIETTTGPLAQGLGNGVGMALAERIMNARFGDEVVDHFTYVIAGDGCLMEGLSHEAASLAGHLGLHKLIVLFDDNKITIDGPTSLTVSDDQLARFAAYGWATQAVDGHDPEAIGQAIAAARASDRPSLIACRTIIGYGAPNKQGTSATHGAALGEPEVAAARERLGWTSDPFEIPADILAAWRAIGGHGADRSADWMRRVEALPEDRRLEFERRLSGILAADWRDALLAVRQAAAKDDKPIATRVASQKAIEALVGVIPEMVGGSADLTGSNNTKGSAQQPIVAGDYSGSYVYYGVREHGMAAAMNGMALHGGVLPYSGTFLVFTDYCRPSIRLSALMGLRVVYVMTHDSIGLGEDGPTHQPIEHLASLRAIPNLNVFRPADAVETAECWELALSMADAPSILALTRQAVPRVRGEASENLSAHGAYILVPAYSERQVTLLASGSEVQIALEAQRLLEDQEIAAAVISMPCWELFQQQPQHYRDEVLGPGTLRVGIEAAASLGWERWLERDGSFIGLTGFGASAPARDLYRHFGLTAEAVIEAVKARL